MNAALTLVADQPAPEPVAKMNMPLIWLYSHCRALGMTKHSDSGQLEHDIALFVADLKDARPPKAEPAPEPLTDEQIASLVSALNVYADPSFYHACTVMFDPPTGGFDEDFSFDAEYGRDMPGKLARETLDAIDTAKAQEQKP